MPLPPQEVEPRILGIVSPVYRDGRLVPQSIHGMAQINVFLGELTQMQERLQALKHDIRLEMQAIRRAYATARGQATPTNHPFTALFLGKKQAIHQGAADRQQLRVAEAAALAPYEHGLVAADSFIHLLEQVKLDARKQVAQQRSTAGAPPAAPPMTTATMMAAPVAASVPVNLHSKVWWCLDPRDAFGCCTDCQRMAAASPYTAPGMGGNELAATPGDGHTRCGAACTCELDYVPPHLKQWDAWGTLSGFAQQVRQTPPERRRALWEGGEG